MTKMVLADSLAQCSTMVELRFVQQEVSAVLVQSLLSLLLGLSQYRTALALGPSVFDRLEELPSALTLRLLLALGAGS